MLRRPSHCGRVWCVVSQPRIGGSVRVGLHDSSSQRWGNLSMYVRDKGNQQLLLLGKGVTNIIREETARMNPAMLDFSQKDWCGHMDFNKYQ